jgi:hypothetical protein
MAESGNILFIIFFITGEREEGWWWNLVEKWEAASEPDCRKAILLALRLCMHCLVT